MTLNSAIHIKRADAPRLVLVHGFTQCGRVWGDVAETFVDRGYDVLAPDLPGHGETDAKYDSVDMWEAGRLLAEAGGDATYVGYSLGARVVLHAALQSDVVARMVLIGTNAGYRNSDTAARRAADDNKLADRAEKIGIEQFIDEWLTHPANMHLPPKLSQRGLRIQNRALGLAESLRHRGVGVQESLWSKLPSIHVPTLVVRGEYDTPIVRSTSEELASTIGSNASHIEIEKTGHAVPFENKDAFVRVVSEFVD